MNYIKEPNLPQGKVTLCAVSAQEVEIITSLKKWGLNVIPVNPIEQLDLPVASHADMQLYHAGGERLILAPHDAQLKRTVEKYGFHIDFTEKLDKKYPLDIRCNAARIGEVCFCNPKGCSSLILERCTKDNITVVAVPQGYAKCSTCVVNRRAIITEDPSIAKAALEYGFDVLQISFGDVVLSGYPYGFLGGCCGLIDKNTIAFTGNISYHRDSAKIERFLEKHNVSPIFLASGKLKDIGGILPLLEQ